MSRMREQDVEPTLERKREMLARMAEASGVATPSAAELKQFDRERKA